MDYKVSWLFHANLKIAIPLIDCAHLELIKLIMPKKQNDSEQVFGKITNKFHGPVLYNFVWNDLDPNLSTCNSMCGLSIRYVYTNL